MKKTGIHAVLQEMHLVGFEAVRQVVLREKIGDCQNAGVLLQEL